MRDAIRKTFLASESCLQALCARLDQHVRVTLEHVQHIDRISFRVKRFESFLTKSAKLINGAPKYANPFEEIEDIVAGRVIVFFLADIPIVLRKLDELFGRIEGDHREPTRDAEFGYECSHRIYHVPSPFRSAPGDIFVPRAFEVQVRTVFMHAYAEPQHELEYKGADELPREIRRELAWIAASAWGADQAYERVLRWTESKRE